MEGPSTDLAAALLAGEKRSAHSERIASLRQRPIGATPPRPRQAPAPQLQRRSTGKRHCQHCGAPGVRQLFCSTSCRKAAARRRRAGLPENVLVGRGRRGSLSLSEQHQLDQLQAELERAREAIAQP
jgi:hypothetical protein